MNEIDEILGTNEEKKYSSKQYDNGKNKSFSNSKNSYIEQNNKEKQKLYNTMNRMTLIISKDSNKFQEYLNVQSIFAKYSVGNCLLILEKFPNAKQIKDEKSWNEKGIYLKSNCKSIKILEPTKSNTKIYYNPKEVYDISQTTSNTEDISINYDDRKILEALLHECDVPRKAVDKLENGEISSMYDKDKNILYVCKGMEREHLFQTLTQEIANIEMKKDEDNNIKKFRSYCISYLICKKYGIDVSNYNFDNIPEEIKKEMSERDIRKQLDKIRIPFEKITSKMSEYFEMSSKEKSKLTPER